jgi:general secretion pathway protein L
MACVAGLCRDIEHSLGVFNVACELPCRPEKILLTGIMSTVAGLADSIGEALQLEVVTGDLAQEAGIIIEDGDGEIWEPAVMDHCLALALQGLAGKTVFNFRRGEFALQKRFFASRTRIAAAAAGAVLLLAAVLGVLAVDYRSLKVKYDDLGGRMEALYRETFPGATRIHDALVQMQANVRNIQAPAIATPVFANEKRILNILADISARIPENVIIHVSRLVIDQDSVQIKGNTDTFNNVNIIQGRLRESPRFAEVNIISAAAEKDTGLIRFELRLKTGGRS